MKYILIYLISLNCFAEFVIVHNGQDKDSREFIAAHAGKNKVIDFYDYENEKTKEFKKLNCGIVDFPTVIDTLTCTGTIKPTSMEDALIKIKSNEVFKISLIKKAMEFGKSIKALVRISTTDRNLTKQQKKALRTNMKDVIEALEDGDILLAKELVEAVPVDGTVVTNDLKTRVLSDIQSFLNGDL
jgi:hypothetical protein